MGILEVYPGDSCVKTVQLQAMQSVEQLRGSLLALHALLGVCLLPCRAKALLWCAARGVRACTTVLVLSVGRD